MNASLGGGAAAQVAPRIFGLRRKLLHLQIHFLSDAVDGEVACHREAVTAGGRHFLGFESHDWKLLHVEEIRAPKVRVALLVVRSDAGNLDTGLYGRGGGVRGVEVDGSADLVKLALHVGDHHVTNLELRGGMRGVDLVSAHLCLSLRFLMPSDACKPSVSCRLRARRVVIGPQRDVLQKQVQHYRSSHHACARHKYQMQAVHQRFTNVYHQRLHQIQPIGRAAEQRLYLRPDLDQQQGIVEKLQPLRWDARRQLAPKLRMIIREQHAAEKRYSHRTADGAKEYR